ncbi:MAG: hypothetical protein H8E41_06350 [Desulfobulbaceae bacterium]|uniref:ACT domain-containing protein n=1 Tax=Candidatus Desulfobia pelagia TaxID=2841692 RepID=A0A8J6TBZ4_9BACT|nr:hypothetical protein [Candidatus Desulfobia pelagia]
MAYTIQKVDYYYTTVRDQPGEAFKLLTILEELGLNLLAFTAVPVGPNSTQLAIFPEDVDKFKHEAQNAQMLLDGPHKAFLVQGDDQLGALAPIHKKLFAANVNIYSSSGVADSKGSYGYIVYVKPDDFGRAVAALDL